MKCSGCGYDNRDAAKFCDGCATLARSGVTWWRLDIPYWVIRLMSICSAVVHYNVADM